MDFSSPRFAGNAVLLDILNDPDSGTKKLQKGSDVVAVRAVQKALFDLGWSLLIDEPVADEATFVDGDYGPATSKTVIAYKTHYGLRFPPDDPNGIVDGFAGPRTLRKLDPQCVLLDDAIAAIDQKVGELQQAGVDVQPADGTRIFDDTPGAFRTALIAGADGAIFFNEGIGAFEVHGAIFASYTGEHGSAEGDLGYPVSDEHDDGEQFRRSDFERGSLRFDKNSGQVEPAPPEPVPPQPPAERTFAVDRREPLDDATLEERLAAARAQLAEAPQDERLLPEGAVASVDPLTGTPDRVVFNTAPNGSDAIDRAHAQATGLIEALTLAAGPELAKGDVIETSAGAQAALLAQTHEQIPVFEAKVAVHVRPDGSLVDVLGSLAPVPGQTDSSTAVDAQAALGATAEHLAANGVAVPPEIAFTPAGDGGFSSDPPGLAPATATQTWFPLGPEDLRIAWETFFMPPGGAESFHTIVDANDGSILYCQTLARDVAASATLFRVDPGHPPAATRNMPVPLSEYPVESRSPLPNPFPRDWVDANAIQGTTVAVHTMTPQGGFNAPLVGQPNGGGVFFPQQAPDFDGVAVHAFYHCGLMHDLFYLLGFREADGAFQRDLPNGRAAMFVMLFDRSQLGFSARAVFLDHAGLNPGIQASFDIDAPIGGVSYDPAIHHHCGADGSVMYHEYTHSVFHRLVGAQRSPQTNALNEGIADFISCAFRDETTIGNYTASATGRQHLRKHEYTSNFPLGFGDLPRLPANAPEHDAGEIWAAAMLDVGRKITPKLAMQLCVDALKLLRGTTPGFLDMRNALFMAASGMVIRSVVDTSFQALPEALFAQPLMWQVFARYGMGPRATSPDNGLRRVTADKGTTGRIAHVTAFRTAAAPALTNGVPARVADASAWISADPATATLTLNRVEPPQLTAVTSAGSGLPAISFLIPTDQGCAAYDAGSGSLAVCTPAPDGSSLSVGAPLTLPRPFPQLVSVGGLFAGYDDASGQLGVFDLSSGAPVELGGSNDLGTGQIAMPFPIGGDPGMLLFERATGTVGQVVIDPQSGFSGFGEGGKGLVDATLVVPLLLEAGQFLLTYRDSDGAMQIDAVDPAGELETVMADVWTRGWTSVVPIALLGQPAVLSYKSGSGTVEVGFIAV